MPLFKNFERSALIEKLSDLTNYFTRLRSKTCKQEEYENYNSMIQLLQTEIKFRQDPVNISHINTAFTGLDKLMLNLNANAKASQS